MRNYKFGDIVKIRDFEVSGDNIVRCVIEKCVDPEWSKYETDGVVNDGGLIVRPLDGYNFGHYRFEQTGQHWAPLDYVVEHIPQNHLEKELFEL